MSLLYYKETDSRDFFPNILQEFNINFRIVFICFDKLFDVYLGNWIKFSNV